MSLFARLVFTTVNFAARNGLAEPDAKSSDKNSRKSRAAKVGVRGETYAYWYLRRHGYVLVARNFTVPDLKGEVDIIGYDGGVLAFVEVKTRTIREQAHLPFAASVQSTPEQAVNSEKRSNLRRVARRVMRARRADPQKCRFDVLAIETRAGKPPVVRLHKGAFPFGAEDHFS